jgi:hypothetical protein
MGSSPCPTKASRAPCGGPTSSHGATSVDCPTTQKSLFFFFFFLGSSNLFSHITFKVCLRLHLNGLKVFLILKKSIFKKIKNVFKGKKKKPKND